MGQNDVLISDFKKLDHSYHHFLFEILLILIRITENFNQNHTQ